MGKSAGQTGNARAAEAKARKQLKKDMDPFVDDQGKEALNFQITVTLMLGVCVLLMLVLIGLLLAWVVGIAALVLVIIAAIKSNEGTAYRYPFCWRLIK